LVKLWLISYRNGSEFDFSRRGVHLEDKVQNYTGSMENQ